MRAVIVPQSLAQVNVSHITAISRSSTRNHTLRCPIHVAKKQKGVGYSLKVDTQLNPNVGVECVIFWRISFMGIGTRKVWPMLRTRVSYRAHTRRLHMHFRQRGVRLTSVPQT